MAKNLYVGGISYDCTESDLRGLFAQAGEVAKVSVIMDSANEGRNKGFAFVEMATVEEGAEAIKQFNGAEFQGRTLTVNEARPREDRGPRPSGGGYNGGGNGGYNGRRDR